jgi:hypothetical protein
MNTTNLLNVTGWEIYYLGDFYRYVSHKEKMATSGFMTMFALKNCKDSFLATPEAIAKCKARYKEYFPNK